MPNEYPRESWINPKIEIESSPLHGKGMFAKAPIDAGEIVVIWGGHYVRQQEDAEKAEQAGKTV